MLCFLIEYLDLLVLLYQPMYHALQATYLTLLLVCISSLHGICHNFRGFCDRLKLLKLMRKVEQHV